MDGADPGQGAASPEEPTVPEPVQSPTTAPVEPGGPAEQPNNRRWWRLQVSTWPEVILFLALLFCYGYFQQVPSWNEFSRYDLVRALVEDGTTRIDRFQENTGDKSFHDGHYYSDKAPGMAFVALPGYVVLSATSTAAGEGTPAPEAAVAALAWLASGVLTALLAVLLLRFLRPAVGERWALVIAGGYGLGSIAFPFATMLFGHAASAFFLFATFYVLWRARSEPRRRWLPLLAGFLAGWAVLTDVSCGLGVVVFMAYALLAGPGVGHIRSRWLARVDLRTPALVVAGAIVPALLLAWYDWASFGSPFSLGYENLANGGFAAGMRQGILGVTMPRPEVLADLIAGPRGLLRLAPWFVLVPLGLLAARRRDLRAEVLVCAAVVAAFLVFNAGYYVPFGGWTPGPRFLLPALPFAAVLVGLAPARARPPTAALVAVAVVLVAIATVTMPNAPEAYKDPMTDLWLPRLFSGDFALTRAWLDWGLPAAASAAILVLGVALAIAALVATFRTGRAARVVTGVSVAGLLALVLVFATPYIPWRAVTVISSSGEGGGITIVATGVTPVVSDAKPGASIWALMRNDGPALEHTKIVFSVSGWSAWSTNVAWSKSDRKRAGVTWDTGSVQPGDYPYDVKVVDQDDETKVYLEVPDAGAVHVGP